jgi:hypothetical protein
MRAAGLLAIASVLAAAPAGAQGMATPDRLQAPGWWPTKSTAARQDFLGPEACAACHAGHSSQGQTSMALTALHAARSPILRERPSLRVRLAGHDYEIATAEGRSSYTVSNGAQSLSLPLGWAFGVGRVGQTYVYERAGSFYESRVSYIQALGRLAFTPARALENPGGLEEAAGRAVGEAEARRCFGCHMTASTTEGRLDLGRLISGVTCEACHGPGTAHVAAVRAGHLAEAKGAILNPGRFDPTTSVDFCGACHATFWDVTLAGEKGLASLRSQPFRLQSSRCWGEGDARLACTSCHDPHAPLVREANAYDARCLSCHTADAGRKATSPPSRLCPVSDRSCAGCHMPKYEVPGMHARFTDHMIRVVGRDATAPGRERGQ